MADIIAGRSKHAPHAPLTHAAALEITSHLQEQITSLKAQIEDAVQRAALTTEGLEGVRQTMSHTNTAVQALREGFESTNHNLDLTRKELQRTGVGLKQLQATSQKHADSLVTLGNAEKLLQSGSDKVARDVGALQAALVEVQQSIQKSVLPGLAAQRDDLGKAQLQTQQLSEALERTRATVQEEREKLQQERDGHSATRDELGKTNMVLGILEGRVGDTAASLAGAHANLQDLNEISLKLHEGHDRCRAQVSELQGQVKRCSAALKEARDGTDKVARLQDLQQSKLAETAKTVDSVRQEKDEHQRSIQQLQQQLAISQESVQALRQELADVDATTRRVKAGLKETSQYLLPNIVNESPQARSDFGRHGSILHTGGTAGIVPQTRSPTGWM